jgi:hypothetical protein
MTNFQYSPWLSFGVSIKLEDSRQFDQRGFLQLANCKLWWTNMLEQMILNCVFSVKRIQARNARGHRANDWFLNAKLLIFIVRLS